MGGDESPGEGGGKTLEGSRIPGGLRSEDAGEEAPERGVRHWVTKWWRGEAGSLGTLVSLFTFPFELMFRSGVSLRNRLYEGGILPLQRAPIPVISLGNLTVGGAGKTPLSAWLARGLLERGHRPALVARGYGSDELELHRRWNPRVPVVAEEDRAFGAWKAARKGATVAILDDGFQHRRLGRDLDIVLVACSTPPRAQLLPRGPFREPFSALRRAGLVVLTDKGDFTGNPALEEGLRPFLREPPVRACLRADDWLDLRGQASSPPEEPFLAVAGIAHPSSLLQVLKEECPAEGELMSFPDHHPYRGEDVRAILRRAAGRTVVTTEKDGVKLERFRSRFPDLRIVHLRVELVEGEERLWRCVQEALGSHRAPSFLPRREGEGER